MKSRYARRSVRIAAHHMVERLETRALLHAPVLDNIANQTIPVGGTLQLPITSTDSEGDKLTYTVQASNNGVTPAFHSGNTWVEMDVSGVTGAGNTAFSGTLTFQLFNDIAPNTAAKISGLAQAGFYDDLTFHRVAKGFVAQGGDPAGNGSGGPGFETEDEINQFTQYLGDGQLAMARSSHDTDGSQFFITDGPQRSSLDYQYTLFGQLVRGRSTLTQLLNTNVQNNSSGENSDPINDPKIDAARVITNNSDGVLQIRAGANTGTSTVTVTVTNEHGESDSQSFTVTREADTVNGAAYLNPFNSSRTTAKNTSITLDLSATDPDGDSITYAAAVVNADGSTAATPNGSYQLNGNQITITPNNNYTGPLYVIVGARDDTHNFDTQIISVGVGDKEASGAAQDLQAAAGAPTPGMVVATFTDADTGGVAGNWSVAFTTDARGNKVGGINWGDGTITNGVVSKSGNTYFVTGNHEYPATGTYQVTITLNGDKGAREIVRSTLTARNIAELSGGTLRIFASSGNDTVGTSVKSGKLNANVNGAIKKFTASQVNRVEYYLFDADDSATVGGGVPVTYMDGGAGNDYLVGGSFNDTLTGGAGKNTLFGGAGNDRLNGSGGRDLIYGQEGDDRMYGNGGDDTIDGGGGVDRAWGGDGNDILIGASSNDKLYGEAGNDTLFGGKGNDLLDGGPGTDVLGDTIGSDSVTSVP